MSDDTPTLGEQMNRGLYLDPGFKPDHDGLVSALEDDIDDTVVRAQAALDKRRHDEAAAELQAAAERRENAAPKSPDQT